MILSAKSGNNADLFPDVLALYVPEQSLVVDATYGNGVFWRRMDQSRYKLVRSDLFTKADILSDFRKMPFRDGSFDAVILDPPYMRTNNSKPQMGMNYNNRRINLRTHKEVLDLYLAGIKEAYRILRSSGVLILKCQDEVMSGHQQWTHVELMQVEGWLTEDLFILIRSGLPLFNWNRQVHARKNHSYFIVLRKMAIR